MPADNQLELAVDAGVNKADASVKTLNTGLPRIEQAASKALVAALPGSIASR